MAQSLDIGGTNIYILAITNAAMAPGALVLPSGGGDLLSDAVDEIGRKRLEEEQRRRRLQARRADLRQLDSWLNRIETMLEDDQREVPEPLVKEIAGFLRELDPKLHRALLRNRTREASRVLDILFDAQEYMLPHFVEITA